MAGLLSCSAGAGRAAMPVATWVSVARRC